MADCKRIEDQIRRTGFVLEHEVAELLRANHWSVISNRYYLDDQEDTVREIDLIGYRSRQAGDFSVFTALIISCKKSDQNAWALLTRKFDADDRNVDWTPAHVWTNVPELTHAMSTPEWKREYHDSLVVEGASAVVAIPVRDIFTFQETNRVSGAPQNDKAIFSAITSLMKAQAYEIESLSGRKTTPCIYQFNLLSVIDADLVRVDLDGGNISAEEVHDEPFIARYIIKKQRTCSRIRFTTRSHFAEILGQYDQLHAANVEVFSGWFNRFYSDILAAPERIAVFFDQFAKAVVSGLQWSVMRSPHRQEELTDLSLSWDAKESQAEVYLSLSAELVERLSADQNAVKVVKDALKRFYRYEGPVALKTDDIPF